MDVTGDKKPFPFEAIGLPISLLEVLLGLGLIAGLIVFVVADLMSSQVGSCTSLICSIINLEKGII